MMNKENAIKLFEQKQVRSAWNDQEEKWFFSIVDIVGILTDSQNTNNIYNTEKPFFFITIPATANLFTFKKFNVTHFVKRNSLQFTNKTKKD